MRKTTFLLFSIVITVFSFFYHSSLFSPTLGSDAGVVVFMTYDFHLPRDLYFWGQNRFGSLVPLIGQVFFKVFHFSPIVSESAAHYLLLIAGFLGFASLFRSNFTKLIFAVIWFLPPYRMLDLLTNTVGEQYSVIGIGVFLMNKFFSIKNEKYNYRHYTLLALITFVFIISIWVSDLAIGTVLIILCVHAALFIKKNRAHDLQLLKKAELYYMLVGVVACIAFISYAKIHSIPAFEAYSQFNLKTFIDSFVIFKGTLVDLFLFRASEPFSSLYCWLTLFFLVYLIIDRKNIKYSSVDLKWILIFAFDAIIGLVIILSSKWAFNNGVPCRYFVSTYIALSIVLLLILESIKERKYRNHIKVLLLSSALIAGFGAIYNLKYIWPKTLKPKIKTVAEFEKLGNIGIIAEYTNAYVNCSDPEMIKATPDDRYEHTINKRSYVRNIELADEVFKQKNLYVIKDCWLNDFPDTLKQFNRVLLKDGDLFRLGDCDVCKYKLLRNTIKANP